MPFAQAVRVRANTLHDQAPNINFQLSDPVCGTKPRRCNAALLVAPFGEFAK
jgi:hypothetical protein